MAVHWLRRAAVLVLLLAAFPALASTHHVRGYCRKDGTCVAPHEAANPGHSTHAKKHATNVATKADPTVPRDSHGRIKRSTSAKREFQRKHACPSTGKTSGSCPGYVIDHVQALCKGGADAPSNMQWQTVAEGKAKDKVECK
jgi:hypothetical protein